MFELLHSFGAGITFALGVFAGAMLLQFANRKAREEFIEDVRRDNVEVTERVKQQVLQLARIADSLERAHGTASEANHVG